MPELRADCSRCAGLCCVALPFRRSADFALDKPAGQPCPHLGAGFDCAIHDQLRPAGFPGCLAYDCFGAGQRLVQEGFGGRDWHAHPEIRAAMFAALPVLRALHELLWYLDDVLARPAAAALHNELRAARDRVLASTGDGRPVPDAVPAARASVAPLLRAASRLVRAGSGRDLAGADLAGAQLVNADLRRAELRNAVLLGADLRGADLALADVLGADLRGADLRGADLRGARLGARLGETLYLTATQVGSARTDATTLLPARLS